MLKQTKAISLVIFLLVATIPFSLSEEAKPDPEPTKEQKEMIDKIQKGESVDPAKFKEAIANKKVMDLYEQTLLKEGSKAGDDPKIVAAWLRTRGNPVSDNDKWTVASAGAGETMQGITFVNGEGKLVLDMTAKEMSGATFNSLRVVLLDGTQMDPEGSQLLTSFKEGVLEATGGGLIVAGKIPIQAGENVDVEAAGKRFSRQQEGDLVVIQKQYVYDSDNRQYLGYEIHNSAYTYELPGGDKETMEQTGENKRTMTILSEKAIAIEAEDLTVIGKTSFIREDDKKIAEINMPAGITLSDAEGCAKCLSPRAMLNGALVADLRGIEKEATFTPINVDSIKVDGADKLTIDLSQSENKEKPSLELSFTELKAKVAIVNGDKSLTINGNGEYAGYPPGSYGLNEITVYPAGKGSIKGYDIDTDGNINYFEFGEGISNDKKAKFDYLKGLMGTVIRDGQSVNPGHKDPNVVRAIQEVLVETNNLKPQKANGQSSIDGDFGPDTRAALRKFQSRNGLDTDGLDGVNTHPKLIAAAEKIWSSSLVGKIEPKVFMEAAPPEKTAEIGPWVTTVTVEQQEPPKEAKTETGSKINWVTPELAELMRLGNYRKAAELLAGDNAALADAIAKENSEKPTLTSWAQAASRWLGSWKPDGIYQEKKAALLNPTETPTVQRGLIRPEMINDLKQNQDAAAAAAKQAEAAAAAQLEADIAYHKAAMDPPAQEQAAVRVIKVRQLLVGAEQRAAAKTETVVASAEPIVSAVTKGIQNGKFSTEDILALATAQAALEGSAAQLLEQRERLQRAIDSKPTIGDPNIDFEYLGELEKTNAKVDEIAKEASVVLAPSEDRTRMSTPGRIKPEPFDQAIGNLHLPVSTTQAEQKISFGQKLDSGKQSDGIVLQTAPGAQVVSPSDGRVVYAGEFRSYGQLLIINAGQGNHILLAGASQLDVQLGQFVLKGEPVAVMDRSNEPVLYVEHRKDGKKLDPSKLWNPQVQATLKKTAQK